jgi:hypothetical protein
MRWLLCAAFAIGVATIIAAQTPTQVADVVLRGGKVITLDAGDRIAEAIAVRGNRILAVGSNSEIARLTGAQTRAIDLQGRSVTPGFIDAHTHTEHTAEFLTFWVSVHSPHLPDAAAILARVRDRVGQQPAGTWVIGQGTFGQVMPTPAELTREFPDHPVVLRWSRHSYVVNQKALGISTRRHSRPSSATSASNPYAFWALAGSIPHATSSPSPSIDGRTDMRTPTTACTTRSNGSSPTATRAPVLWRANRSGSSRSPTRMPPRVHRRTRHFSKHIAPCPRYSNAARTRS